MNIEQVCRKLFLLIFLFGVIAVTRVILLSTVKGGTGVNTVIPATAATLKHSVKYLPAIL